VEPIDVEAHSAPAGVRIRYPFPAESRPTDGAWLLETAERHGGWVGQWEMFSAPGQVDLFFPDEHAARAFSAAVARAGRFGVSPS
jgi:hypothetical protein